MKRAAWLLLTIIALAIGAGLGWSYWQQPETPAALAITAAAEPASQQVARGKYLALAGNCVSCHTARGGLAYAGGRAIETPFGQIFSPNLTPDNKTGLGSWSPDDFWRAMHHGKSKGGRLLYPAFPYPNYTKVTRADSDALFAYLSTLPPAVQAKREHTLRFPYNNQFVLAIWRALYFTPGVFQPEPTRSAAWNRGAYLVTGLGHCNACHTSRDALGGTNLKADLAGGVMPISNWYAPALTASTEAGLGNWQQQQLADLLRHGISQRGAVSGPMAEVVYKSLQYLTESDVQAMAEYLKSLPHAHAQARSQINAPQAQSESMTLIMAWGAKLYKEHCIDCHGEAGAGKPPAYQPLAGNSSLTTRSAVNAIRMVLDGGYPPGTTGNPRPYGMPPFRTTLSSQEVAAVLSYIRNSWGNKGGMVTPDEVNFYWAAPIN